MSELSAKQKLAILRLASGMRNSVVAQDVGVSERQLYNWLDTPLFRNALNQLLGEIEQAGRVKILGLLDTSIAALSSVLTDPETPANVRAGTALKIIEMTLSKNSASVPSGEDTDRPRIISLATIKTIRESIYGIYGIHGEDLEPEPEQKRLPGSI